MSVTPLADTWGRVAGSSEQNYGEVGPGELRVSVFDPLPRPIWVKRIGVWGGRKDAIAPTVRNVLYRDTGSAGPNSRLGYTAAYQPTAQQVAGSGDEDASGGAAQEYDVQQVDAGPSTSAILCKTGWRLGVGVIVQDAIFGHSRRAAANIHADDENFYERSGLGGLTPPDPFGSYTSQDAGHITAWLRGEWNERPAVPVNRVPSASIQSQTPVFEGDFRDNDGAWGDSNGTGIDRGDMIQAVKVWIRRADTQQQVWSDRRTCDRNEQRDNRFAVPCGVTLTRGVAYEWQCQVQDMADEWSELSSWLGVSIASLGAITLDGDPTGVIQTVTPAFQGRWFHVNGLNMSELKVRLLRDDVVRAESAAFAKSVASAGAPGTLFTATWAEINFGTPVNLEWGQDNYFYQMSGKDTNGQWSDWSAPRGFLTNTPPTVPRRIAPDNGAVFTVFPLLQYTFSDPDDDASTGLACDVEITRPNASTVTVATTYTPATGYWEFQTTGTELTAFGEYSIRARSFDGTTYSGGFTSSGNAVWSHASTFTYLAGPAVSIDMPADGAAVATAGARIAWTTADQTKYRLWVYRPDGTVPLYDSGLITSANRFHDVPAGLWHEGDLLFVVVEITNSSSVVGRSDPRYFFIDYAPAPAIALIECAAYRFVDDPWDTGVRLRYSQTTLTDDFAGYYLWRRTGDDPADDQLFAIVADPGQTDFVDAHAPIGVEATYSVAQAQYVPDTNDSQVTLGERSSLAISLVIDGVVLVSVTDPTRRIVLDSVQEMPDDLELLEVVHQPLSQRAPSSVRKRANYWQTTIHATIYDRTPNGGPTAQRRYEQMKRALRVDDATIQSGDTSFAGGGTFSYRNERGTRRFVTIDKAKVVPQRVQAYGVTLPLREEQFSDLVTGVVSG